MCNSQYVTTYQFTVCIAVQLKRRSQYQHAVLTSNIRPSCIREVGTYLGQHGKLFQQEKISFNHTVLQSLESDNILTVSDSSAVSSDITTVQSDNASVNAEPSSSAVAADEEDSWNEDNDTQVERAGVFDTLFSVYISRLC